MNNKIVLAVVGIAAAVIGGYVGGVLAQRATMTGGDFAGGVVPNQLFTANTATNGITPIGNLSLGFGGTAAANQIPIEYTAAATYPWTPSSTSAITLGSSTIVLAATTTQVTVPSAGFVVGDPCEVQYNFTTSTLLTSANITAVNGTTATATVQLFNANGAPVTFNVTSTVTGVTSTVKTTCFATGV